MKIYVAHTYGRRHGLSEAECETNALKAVEIGRALIKKGHNPFIPNLWHFIHKGWQDSPQENHWFTLVSEWLQFCDAILIAEMPPWENSGVERELELAKSLGLTVYYSLDEIPYDDRIYWD